MNRNHEDPNRNQTLKELGPGWGNRCGSKYEEHASKLHTCFHGGSEEEAVSYALGVEVV